jgi:hypothetical protein
VYNDWKINSELDDIRSLVHNMGIPDIADQMTKLEHVIRRLGQVEALEYNGRNMSDIYKHLWALITILQLSYEEHNAFRKITSNLPTKRKQTVTTVTSDLQNIRRASVLFTNRVQAQKIDDLMARNAIVRI